MGTHALPPTLGGDMGFSAHLLLVNLIRRPITKTTGARHDTGVMSAQVFNLTSFRNEQLQMWFATISRLVRNSQVYTVKAHIYDSKHT